MPTELDRALAFEEALSARSAERIVPFRSGRAYFNDSFPRVWDLNFLRVDGGKTVDPGELAAEAELLHTDAGHAHRRVEVPDEQAGARLEAFFRRLGWKIEREVIMVYRGAGERSTDTSIVEKVASEDLVALREEISRAESWATDEEALREVLAAGRIWGTIANARSFAVRVDGAAVSAAELYSDGRVAQVEDVVTLPAQRGHGYASAVVLRAVEEALAAGNDLVFLVAVDEDWPKELYGRLGFETVGRTWNFLRTPVPVARD
ncbi:MAG: GNAT family N-acetyltransferase [Gaiellaceae bacterium]